MTQDSLPSVRSMVVIPAIITLAVTALRLGLELSGASAWLANSEAGGQWAVIGIVWLPFLFGPHFALKLRPHFDGQKGLYKRLAKTLLVYGLLARIPVVLIGIFAILGDWGTHYERFPPDFDLGTGGKIGMTFVAQLGFWACLVTTLTGLIAGFVALLLRPKQSA